MNFVWDINKNKDFILFQRQMYGSIHKHFYLTWLWWSSFSIFPFFSLFTESILLMQMQIVFIYANRPSANVYIARTMNISVNVCVISTRPAKKKQYYRYSFDIFIHLHAHIHIRCTHIQLSVLHAEKCFSPIMRFGS